MGHSQVYPVYSNNKLPQTPMNDSIAKNLSILKIDNDQAEQAVHVSQPITIPRFQVRSSPFKIFMLKQELASQRHTSSSIESHTDLTNAQTQYKIPSQLWNSVIYNRKILCIILDMLPTRDCIRIGELNRRLNCELYMYRLFHKSDNWDITKLVIQSRIKTNTNINQFNYNKSLSQSYNQQSQHSLDLDRLDSLFSVDESVQKLQQLDNVMKVLNYNGVPYFQGLNCIVIALVNLFNQEISFYLTQLILEKSQNVHQNTNVYQQLMRKIQKNIKQKRPQLFQKFESCQLDIQYFCMKWVMSLFSADLNQSILIYFWDLLLNFGITALQWFIVSLFTHLEDQILSMQNSDIINKKMKHELRHMISLELQTKILQDTRILMSEQIFGTGCWELSQNWKNHNNQRKMKLLEQFEQIACNHNSINPINQLEYQNLSSQELCQSQKSQIQANNENISISKSNLASNYSQKIQQACNIQNESQKNNIQFNDKELNVKNAKIYQRCNDLALIKLEDTVIRSHRKINEKTVYSQSQKLHKSF